MIRFISIIDPFDFHKRSRAELHQLYLAQTRAIRESLHIPEKPVTEPNLTKVTFSQAAILALEAEQARERGLLK